MCVKFSSNLNFEYVYFPNGYHSYNSNKTGNSIPIYQVLFPLKLRAILNLFFSEMKFSENYFLCFEKFRVCEMFSCGLRVKWSLTDTMLFSLCEVSYFILPAYFMISVYIPYHIYICDEDNTD